MMESIVYKLDKIYLTENCAPNYNIEVNKYNWCLQTAAAAAVAMTTSANTTGADIEMQPKQTNDDDDGGDKSSELIDSDVYEDVPTTSRSAFRDGLRRRMPARSTQDNTKLKMNRRSIMKPTKRKELRLSDIKKLYLNKKLTKFRPSNLETIFEETHNESNNLNAATGSEQQNDDEEEQQVQFVKIGGKKLRRSISLSDGINITKTMLLKRRAKIKKTFGRRFALKRIKLSEFHERLNKSFDDATLDVVEQQQPPDPAECQPDAIETDIEEVGVLVKSKSFSGNL